MSNMYFIGDIAFTGILNSSITKNLVRFNKIVPILSGSTMVFANLEVPLKVDDIRNEYKNLIHYSYLETTKQLLTLFNISCVSLANNHIYDCKMPGLQATINMLDRLGIYHTGAGWLTEHIKPVIFYNSGLRIAFVAYVDVSTNPRTENFPELLINLFDIEKVVIDIGNLRKEVDKVIVSLHWGSDYSFYPLPKQIEIAHYLIDEGVDIIMGHHPHTIQPYEKYNNGHIFYSLGGLTFGDYQKPGKKQLQALYRKTKRGLIAKYDTISNKFRFISTLEKKGNYIKITKRDYQLWSNRKWVLFRIKYSSKGMFILFNLKEKLLDRIYEYFFGYYQNPLKRLCQISNIKKIGRLFK